MSVPTPPSDEFGAESYGEDPRSQPGRSYGVNLVITASSNLALPMAALITSPFLARGLGVADRGHLAAATAPMLLAGTAATFGLPEALTYFTARRPQAARAMLYRALRVLLVGAVLVALLAIGAADWLAGGNPEVRDLIIGLSILIPPAIAVGAARGVAMGLHRWRLVALERITSAVLRVVAVFALFFTGQLTVVTAALAITGPTAVTLLVYLPIFRLRAAPAVLTETQDTSSEASAASVSELSRFGLRAWAGSVSGILLSRLDQAIMVPIAGSTQLGLYTVATNIADVTVLANNAMRDVTLAADAAERKDARLFRTARVSLLVALAVALVVCATVWWWIDLVFGSEFHDATSAVLILIASAAIATPGSVMGAALTARGLPGLRSISLFGAFIADIVALVLLGPALGAVGAAIATAIGNQVAANMNVFFYARRFPLRRRDIYFFGADDVRTVLAGLAAVRSRLWQQLRVQR
ncbi:lipopolysaccharide biosynthesis protein [Flexivirga sp. B27]